MLAMKAKALFLDRDGVINVDKSYVYKVQDFEFCAGIFELCEFFSQKGFKIFVITNQSGIERGFYSEKDFEKLSEFMLGEFAKKGISISKVYHCPHLQGCECRKPKPGMILKAQAEFDIDLANSILIGDNFTDMQAGQNAGIKELCLVKKACEQTSEFKDENFKKGEKLSENSSKTSEFYTEFANLDEIKDFFKDRL